MFSSNVTRLQFKLSRDPDRGVNGSELEGERSDCCRRWRTGAAPTSIRLPQAALNSLEYHVRRKQALIVKGVKSVTAMIINFKMFV